MKLHKFILLFVMVYISVFAMAQTSLDTSSVTILTKSMGIVSGRIISENHKSVEIKTEELGTFSIDKKEIISENQVSIISEKQVTIKTRDKKEFTGEIKSQDTEKIVLQTKYYGPVTILRKDVVFNNVKNGFDEIRKNAISGNIFGSTPAAGAIYERLLSRKFSLEAGIGLLSVGGGIKYFPFNVRESKPFLHTGVSVFIVAIPLGYGAIPTSIYFPIGVSKFGKNRFNFGLDVGPAFWSEEISNSKTTFYGSIKIGKRF